MLGVGTVQTDSGVETEEFVGEAISAGYRFIDTASVYENEGDVGRAIRSSPVQRQDLFISTKAWNTELGYDATLSAFDNSLRRLGLDYVDLYQIHWPLVRLRMESWRAMCHLVDIGRCRAIGVCNFTPRHIEELVEGTRTAPAVNQVEFNPYLNQSELLRWCGGRGIQLITYNPLGNGKWKRDQRLAGISERYSKHPFQILIRWAIQKGVAVVMRTTNLEELRHSTDVFDFELSLRDMGTLDGFHENLRTNWDPTRAP